MIDMSALATKVRAAREASGLNVRFTDKDSGEVKILSFASERSRDSFIARARHQGHRAETE
jgi:hypothetical protein